MSQKKLVCNVLVIGGGPVGSSVAFHLAKAGATNIVILEKDLCFRSTSAMLSAGGIRQQFSVPENIKMSMYGAEFIKNPTQLTVGNEVPDLQFHENGYLFLSGERSKHILKENYKTQRSCGADWMKLMEGPELQEKFPWLSLDDPIEHHPLVLGSYGTKNEGYFDPWLFVNALKKKNEALGVRYLEGKAVKASLLPTKGGSSYLIDSLFIHSQGPVEAIHADHIVNCAGAWSGQFLHLLSSSHSTPSPRLFPLPVYPRKRCIFTFTCKATEQHPIPPSSTPLTIDPSGVYFRPDGGAGAGGRFLCGVSPSEDQDPNISPPNEQQALQSPDHHLFEEVIWPVLARRVRAFEGVKLSSSWAGFYDYNTFDQNAIIGPHSEVRNLTLCSGFSGHGLQQSPAAGRAVAELLVEGKYTSLDLSRFGLERVIDNKPVFETGIV